MSNEGLPDWCQVGKWVWCPRHYKISGIDYVKGDWRYVAGISDKGIKTHTYSEEVPFAECNEARVRPWKFDEAPLGVKCRNKLTNGSLFVAYLNQTGDGYKVIDSETDVDFNTMATTYIQYDYKPCGVLQHRDEVGQWTSAVNSWHRYMNLSGERILTKPYAEIVNYGGVEARTIFDIGNVDMKELSMSASDALHTTAESEGKDE